MPIQAPRAALLAASLVLTAACETRAPDRRADHVATAERYFRGVYGSDTAAVNDLVGDSIVITYPVFESLFGTPTIRGREAVKAFVVHFGQRWADPQMTVDDAVAEGDRVVLMWRFRARNRMPDPSEPADTTEVDSWGGITLLRFDDTGRVVAEIGEESTPGPMGRLAS